MVAFFEFWLGTTKEHALLRILANFDHKSFESCTILSYLLVLKAAKYFESSKTHMLRCYGRLQPVTTHPRIAIGLSDAIESRPAGRARAKLRQSRDVRDVRPPVHLAPPAAPARGRQWPPAPPPRARAWRRDCAAPGQAARVERRQVQPVRADDLPGPRSVRPQRPGGRG
jgi:hypothetical protein